MHIIKRHCYPSVQNTVIDLTDDLLKQIWKEKQLFQHKMIKRMSASSHTFQTHV